MDIHNLLYTAEIKMDSIFFEISLEENGIEILLRTDIKNLLLFKLSNEFLRTYLKDADKMFNKITLETQNENT